MGLRLLAALAAFAFLPSIAAAQVGPPQPAAPQSTAPEPGMQFTGTLFQTVSSKTANVGDQVALTNVNSTDDSIQGARLFGRVTQVTRAGQGRNGQVYMTFDTLQLANGTMYPVVGQVIQVQVKTGNNAAKEVLGTLGGMIVGNILGKWLGTNAGGALGAAGGFIVAKNNRQDVSVPANSDIRVRLVQPHPQEPEGGQYVPAEPQQQPAPQDVPQHT